MERKLSQGRTQKFHSTYSLRSSEGGAQRVASFPKCPFRLGYYISETARQTAPCAISAGRFQVMDTGPMSSLVMDTSDVVISALRHFRHVVTRDGHGAHPAMSISRFPAARKRSLLRQSQLGKYRRLQTAKTKPRYKIDLVKTPPSLTRQLRKG